MVNPYVGYGTCPQCGMPLSQMGFQPTWGYGPMGPGMGGGFGPGFSPWMGGGYGYGGYGGFGGWGPGGPTWGGTYGYFGTTPSDEEIRNMIYDSLDADPTIPYDSDINVDVTGGLVTLTGTVPSKRIKHAAGDDAWWVPGVIDINNQLSISGRRGRGEGQPGTGQTGQGQ